MMTLKHILQQAKDRAYLLVLLGITLLLTACHDECPPIQVYINQGIDKESCVLCKLFEVFVETAIDVADKSWDIFSRPLIPVVALVSAIYIAIYTLKLGGSFGKQTATDFIAGDKRGLLMLMFKTAIIIFLLKGKYNTSGLLEAIQAFLSGQNFIVEKIISPILSAGLEIGSKLAITGAPGDNSFSFFDDIEGIISKLIESPWSTLFHKIEKAVYGFNQSSYETIAIGEAMICNSTEDSVFSWYYLMLLYGFIIFVFGWLMLLAIAFYIIDILINLTFGAVLLPIGIACAISKVTSVYSKNIWNIFINAFFSFILLGIIIGLSMQMVVLCLQGGDDINKAGGALSNFISNRQMLIDENLVKELSEELWTNGSLLLTIVCFSVLICLIPQTSKLASKISGTSSLSTAATAAGAGVSSVTTGAAKSMAVQTYRRHIKPAMADAGEKISKKTGLDKVSHGLNVLRGQLTGTGSEGHRAFWR